MPKRAKNSGGWLAIRRPTGFLTALVLSVASVPFATSQSFAISITYTAQATASGSLGGVAFTNADVVFSLTGDTSNATRVVSRAGSIVDTNFGTVRVSVADAMPATFTDNAGVFHNFGAGAIAGNLGFAGVISGNEGSSTIFIMLANSSTLASSLYDLKTSIGPLSGPAQITGLSFATTGGNFILNSVGATATFSASVDTATAAVPEPASLTLLGIGIGLTVFPTMCRHHPRPPRSRRPSIYLAGESRRRRRSRSIPKDCPPARKVAKNLLPAGAPASQRHHLGSAVE
jgi:hypothetical protein